MTSSTAAPVTALEVPQRLFDHALAVRLWTRDYAKDNSIGFSASRADNLQGYCGIASVELWQRLRCAGIGTRVVFCDGHVLVDAYTEGRLWYLDVTATQFSDALPHIWCSPSLVEMQRIARTYANEDVVVCYRPTARVQSMRGIAKHFSTWLNEERHPMVNDLIAQEAVREFLKRKAS